MSAPDEAFYSEERWENWLSRVREEPADPEDEESARLLLNLQNDVAIAVAKILTARDDGTIDRETALDELETIHAIVLEDPQIEDEDTAMLVDGVQTSLVCVFYAAEQYLADGVAEEATVEEYVHAAAAAEQDEEFDRALGLCAAGGTRIIANEFDEGGEDLDMTVLDELEYGLVTEWLNGLESLRNALGDPEVIEDEDEDEDEDGSGDADQ